jgi:hypothetical protein
MGKVNLSKPFSGSGVSMGSIPISVFIISLSISLAISSDSKVVSSASASIP